jgi:hypothetical protein
MAKVDPAIEFPPADDDFDMVMGAVPPTKDAAPRDRPHTGRGRGGCRGRGRGAGAAAGETKAAYEHCNVCMSPDMAKGMKQCKTHNKSVGAIDETLKVKDEAQKSHSRKEFQELRDNAPLHPPSQFANVVLDFEKEYPSQGSGKKRGNTPEATFEIIEKHSVKTTTTKGSEMDMMHEEQWMKMRVETHCYPYAEAKEMWDAIKAIIPEEECDEKGPKHSKHRQPMPTRDFTSLAQTIEQLKELDMRSGKRQKLAGPEQLASLQQSLSTGHAGFDHEMFNEVGGRGAAAVLEACGSSRSALSGAPVNNIFAKQLEEAAAVQASKKKETLQKAKFFDMEICKNRLFGKFDNLRKNLQHKMDAVKIALVAMEGEAAANESKHIPNLAQVF